MKLLALLLLCACAHGYGIIPPPARASDKNAKHVRDVIPFANEYAWRRSAYFRPGDPIGEWPWEIILADDYSACVIFGQTMYLPLSGSYWNCPSSWRMARP